MFVRLKHVGEKSSAYMYLVLEGVQISIRCFIFVGCRIICQNIGHTRPQRFSCRNAKKEMYSAGDEFENNVNTTSHK